MIAIGCFGRTEMGLIRWLDFGKKTNHKARMLIVAIIKPCSVIRCDYRVKRLAYFWYCRVEALSKKIAAHNII